MDRGFRTPGCGYLAPSANVAIQADGGGSFRGAPGGGRLWATPGSAAAGQLARGAPANKADVERLRAEVEHVYNDLVERRADTETKLLTAFYSYTESNRSD